MIDHHQPLFAIINQPTDHYIFITFAMSLTNITVAGFHNVVHHSSVVAVIDIARRARRWRWSFRSCSCPSSTRRSWCGAGWCHTAQCNARCDACCVARGKGSVRVNWSVVRVFCMFCSASAAVFLGALGAVAICCHMLLLLSSPCVLFLCFGVCDWYSRCWWWWEWLWLLGSRDSYQAVAFWLIKVLSCKPLWISSCRIPSFKYPGKSLLQWNGTYSTMKA